MAVLNILIVEDNAGDRRLLRLALLEQAYECMVDEVDGAEAALEMLAQNAASVDVVLLDGRLNGANSTSVIDRIKGLAGTHIVVLTGSSSKAEHAEFISHGADAVMEKTAELDGLIENLSKLKRYAGLAKIRSNLRQQLQS
ncbi:response regulator [Paramagnetospirillum magneticum]|nr:response regulator [Paramagnetospirillum magneticum]